MIDRLLKVRGIVKPVISTQLKWNYSVSFHELIRLRLNTLYLNNRFEKQPN